jgi:small subunit ribosomal protein S1
MDDGYWEALLRDVDGEMTISHRDAKESAGARDEGYRSEAWRPAAGDVEDGEEKDWAEAQALLSSGQATVVTVSGYNRGGLLANLGRIQGFLPASHLLTPPAVQAPGPRMAALAARGGEKLTVRVIEIEREQRRLILSERCAQPDGPVASLLASLAPEQVRQGTVTNLCAFGAFVDLGGFEGLIHISELSWGRVNTPSEVVRPGEQVEVLVLDVNPQAQKIALSLKRLRPDPWQGVEQRYQVGQVIEGVVTNVVSFGAFARLEEGLEGLIHISELAEGSFMHPRNIVNEGDRVRVRVLHVDGANRRLALTMRSGDLSARGRTDLQPEAELPT